MATERELFVKHLGELAAANRRAYERALEQLRRAYLEQQARKESE